jgi:hypothetical protein
MGNTNYFGGVIKILEPPKQKFLKNNHILVTFRAQLPQIRKNRIVRIFVWGRLAKDVLNYYKVNDYILIEGYVSLKAKSSKFSTRIISRKVEISVFKVYPFILSYNRSIQKI